jgi:hypothetical protein
MCWGDPRDAQALIVLGNHYARRAGDPVAARRFLERAAEITPDDVLVHTPDWLMRGMGNRWC